MGSGKWEVDILFMILRLLFSDMTPGGDDNGKAFFHWVIANTVHFGGWEVDINDGMASPYCLHL